MAVFPENMDRLNVQDPTASLSVIENYIRYMSERIEFSMRNMTKTVSAAGVSSAELYILLQAQSQLIATLQSAIGIIQGAVRSLQNSVTTAQEDIEGLQEETTYMQEDIEAAQSDITALQTNVSEIEQSLSEFETAITELEAEITAINTELADHEQRISALEHPTA